MPPAADGNRRPRSPAPDSFDLCPPARSMRLKLIACEILYREFCWAVARSLHRVDVEFLPKGLHDIGQAGMHARLKRWRSRRPTRGDFRRTTDGVRPL